MDKGELMSKVQEVAKAVGGIEKVMLFGSYFKGEETNSSDLDLIIKMEDSYDSDTFFDYLTKLEEELGLEVDLHTYEGVSRANHMRYLLEDGGSEIIYCA